MTGGCPRYFKMNTNTYIETQKHPRKGCMQQIRHIFTRNLFTMGDVGDRKHFREIVLLVIIK